VTCQYSDEELMGWSHPLPRCGTQRSQIFAIPLFPHKPRNLKILSLAG